MPSTTPDSPSDPRKGDGPTGGTAASTPLPDTPPVEGLSYEQARDELVSVVARLEAGGETLEVSLALWERGEALAGRCQQWLDGARERLDAARADGPAQLDDRPRRPDEDQR